MPGFDTTSGGTVTLEINKDKFVGHGLYLEIDQSGNINNTDDSAGIILNSGEVRNLIDLLHDWIKFVEGNEYFKKISDIKSDNSQTTENTQ